MVAILKNECLREDGRLYPYFIRINRSGDANRLKKLGINIELGHILKCYSPRECAKDTKFLLALGINNLDLGPFQINYKYHHYRWKNKSLEGYFDPSLAEDRARDIVVGLINRYGYSWETLGRYNHYNPKNKTKNRIYYSRLYKHIYEAH